MQTHVPSEHWQRGDWMQTFTGRRFYPLAPRAEDVNIRDIAHSLSMQCRYNGHVKRFYSVAEHCLALSYNVPEEDQGWALLHDASEAYVGDLIRPVKRSMPEFCTAEGFVMGAITERYGLSDEVPTSVHEADTRILLDERAQFLTAPPAKWSTNLDPLGVLLRGLPPSEAEETYLARFVELFPAHLEEAYNGN